MELRVTEVLPIIGVAVERFYNRTGKPPQLVTLCPEWHKRIQQEIIDRARLYSIRTIGKVIGPASVSTYAFGDVTVAFERDDIPELFRIERLSAPFPVIRFEFKSGGPLIGEEAIGTIVGVKGDGKFDIYFGRQGDRMYVLEGYIVPEPDDNEVHGGVGAIDEMLKFSMGNKFDFNVSRDDLLRQLRAAMQ